MATASQISANQANAQFSTGPVTAAGRAASALNNLNHGFRSAAVLLPSDDPAQYESLLAELTKHFTPCDLTEDRFVREMTDAEWRLRRVRACTASAIARQMEKLAAASDATEPNLIDLQSRAIETLAEAGCSYATWLRYETKFENQYERNYRAWTRYQDARRRVSSKEADIAIKQAIAQPLPALVPVDDDETVRLIPAKSGRSTTATGQLGSNVQTASQAPVDHRADSGLLIPAKSGRSHAPVVQARTAPCPCGSGEKYKRCCGRTAPGQIHPSLRKAA